MATAQGTVIFAALKEADKYIQSNKRTANWYEDQGIMSSHIKRDRIQTSNTAIDSHLAILSWMGKIWRAATSHPEYNQNAIPKDRKRPPKLLALYQSATTKIAVAYFDARAGALEPPLSRRMSCDDSKPEDDSLAIKGNPRERLPGFGWARGGGHNGPGVLRFCVRTCVSAETETSVSLETMKHRTMGE
ncbi:hypothetical protein CPB85DRAFT_1254886 [Mucidula mucida]|nr:hypothetical protein CPB85DRAFT_1254886 [Mucidula mucida]